MGIFNEIGHFFKDLFKEDVSTEKEQELLNTLAGMEVKERQRLEEIVKDYSESYRPEDKTFEYLQEYEPIDEQTLRENSKDYYQDSYNSEKDKTNNKYKEQLENVEQTEKGYIEDAEKKNDSYTEKYNDKTESFKSTASKNGIADSSIIGAKKSDLESERDRYIGEVMQAMQNKLNKTKTKKDNLKTEQENKIASLDAAFTKNVENMFNKLLDEENKKAEEVVNANKKTAQEEKNYKEYQDRVVKEKAKEMQDMQAEMKEAELNGTFNSPEREREYDERLRIAKEFYSGFSRQSALESIDKNAPLKAFLGPRYYRLIREIQNG